MIKEAFCIISVIMQHEGVIKREYWINLILILFVENNLIESQTVC